MGKIIAFFAKIFGFAPVKTKKPKRKAIYGDMSAAINAAMEKEK